MRHLPWRSSLGPFVFCVIAALACAKSDTVAAPDDPSAASLSAELRGRILLVNTVDSPAWATDPLTLGAMTIDGDTLSLTVSYGGGCRRHALQPIAETAWMESFPVQVRARIAHNADGDLCRALITRVLRIDLSPLKERYQESYQTAHGRIRLNIPGAETVPVYEF